MSNIVVAGTLGQVSTVFKDTGGADELSAGIGQSFGVISYKGKVWGIKFQGNETKLMREDGDGPRNSIEVVIVKSAAAISKIWYEKGFEEGSTAPPDCWSTNGVNPDPASPKKQSTTCAGCPRNAWGSKVTEAGKQGKECADSKRLAVVPLDDINNELFNGPMLLRVPAASLKDVGLYGSQLQQVGYPYYGVGTRISFDAEEAYPKFKLGAIRALTDAEAKVIVELREDERVKRILNMAVENVTHEPEKPKPTVASLFEQPPEEAKPEPKVEVKPEVKTIEAEVVAEKPKPKVVVAKPKEPEINWVEAELEDGTPVWYDEASGNFKPREVAKPKVTVVSKPTPVAVAEEEAGAAPSSFDDLLQNLMKSDE